MTSQVTTKADPAEADFKTKYKVLKKKLKSLVYEHELLTEELDKSQRKLLRVSKDRSFLLDRLLQYEKVGDSSSDSEATDNSDSESEKPSNKRKTPAPSASKPATTENNGDVVKVKSEPPASTAKTPTMEAPTKKKSRSSKKQKLNPMSELSTPVPNLSMEEIEKHLESRPQMMSIEKATSLLPSEIFSNEHSFLDSEGTSDNDLDTDLIIDMK